MGVEPRKPTHLVWVQDYGLMELFHMYIIVISVSVFFTYI